jgi:hypothetical protein
MGRIPYVVLCAVLGSGMVLFGLALTAQFFLYHMPNSTPMIPTGPTGHYFVAFAGTSLVAWGGCLLGAARRPDLGSIGTATAVGLVLSAIYRMFAWLVGDYAAWLGDLPRLEAAVFLLLALAFVWLRPPAPGRVSGAT